MLLAFGSGWVFRNHWDWHVMMRLVHVCTCSLGFRTNAFWGVDMNRTKWVPSFFFLLEVELETWPGWNSTETAWVHISTSRTESEGG